LQSGTETQASSNEESHSESILGKRRHIDDISEELKIKQKRSKLTDSLDSD
jgi:hypothetical protein